MRRALLLLAALALMLSAVPAAATSGVSGTGADSLPPHHPTTVLVGFSEGADATQLHRLAGAGRLANVIPGIDVHVVTVPAGTVAAAIRAYERLPGVAFAEPNVAMELLGQPDDPRYPSQYGLERISAETGWERYDPSGAFATTGGATLAIVDTGIDLLHPELEEKVIDCSSWLTGLGVRVPDVCQDSNVHGTHVAGIAAAATNNGIGIAGVAFDAEILALQACTYLCMTADTAAAIVYAGDAGAEVANYSFGGSGTTQTLREAAAHAHDKGVLQIAAAGNDGAADSVNYPAALPEVVAVSSTDTSDNLSSFSSYGPQVDVAAPGTSIISTIPARQYLSLGGTSMASPHVAGLGALLRATGLSAEEARSAILDGADKVGGATGETDEFGHGRINVDRSLAIAAERQAQDSS